MTIRDILSLIPNLSAFAEAAGIPYSTVRRLSKSGRRPSRRTLRLMPEQIRRDRESLARCEGALGAMLERK